MSENIKLIEGSFSGVEAKKLLLCLIDDKIKFHNSKILEDFEKGNENEYSELRIKELKKLRLHIIEYLDNLGEKNLNINSIINIEEID
jgi:hypothetical protein